MANARGRGPKSSSPEDIYIWAVAHDVDIQGRWNTQWKSNDGVVETAKDRRNRCEGHFNDVNKRLRLVEDSVANIRGRIAVYAAVGAVIGGAAASIVINLLLR